MQGRREQLPEACHILAEGDASHELLLLGDIVDEGGDFLSVTASGFKGEGHETVAKVVEVVLLQPVLEGGSFASSIGILLDAVWMRVLLRGQVTVRSRPRGLSLISLAHGIDTRLTYVQS